MLSLDDGAMARIAIGAGAVPPAERGEWLELVAHKFEATARAHRPSRAAKNMRQYRKRQHSGQVVLRVPVDHAAVTEALIATGVLNEHEALDKRRVEAAIAAQIGAWAGAFK